MYTCSGQTELSISVKLYPSISIRVESILTPVENIQFYHYDSAYNWDHANSGLLTLENILKSLVKPEADQDTHLWPFGMLILIFLGPLNM